MIYDIRQTTTYRYASPVVYARHVLRLTPIDRVGQRVNAAALDLIVLDPNNPRSVAYQLARIETHLATLPKRTDESRLSPPEQIATALVARIRTADAAALDQETFVGAEVALMKLADLVGSSYFTTHERAEVRWGALG